LYFRNVTLLKHFCVSMYRNTMQRVIVCPMSTAVQAASPSFIWEKLSAEFFKVACWRVLTCFALGCAYIAEMQWCAECLAPLKRC
jgi:hypothetical protein